MKKGFVIDLILYIFIIAVFVLWIVVLLNLPKAAERKLEKEVDKIVDVDSKKIKVITESPVAEVATAEISPQESETIITDELYPETEKPVETAVSTEKQDETETETQPVTQAVTETATANGYIGTFKVTGYTHEEGFSFGKTTASGIGCREGICAMNRTRMKELGINYGNNITVEGLGTFTVADCGCSYNTVDIWCWTNAESYALTGHYNVYVSE